MTESNALERVVDVAVDVLSPLSGATRDHRTLVALLNQMGGRRPGSISRSWPPRFRL